MTKKTVDGPTISNFRDWTDKAQYNRRLLEWLEDDVHRAALYKLITENGGSLDFPSRDTGQRETIGLGPEAFRPPPETGHRQVRLVTHRDRIETALRDDGRQHSNRIYGELGDGKFMLSLDTEPDAAHAEQRKAYCHGFKHSPEHIQELSHLACQAASIMSLRAPEFDLAAFAEQAAVRFCQKLLGYAFTDHRLLETSLRAAYHGLVYQVLGRHFATEPLALPEAKRAMGMLLARTSVLIDAYATDDKDALKGCTDHAVPNGLEPVMKRLGEYKGDLNGEQLAVIAVGAAVGTVGNVQAAACIAVKAFFSDSELLKSACDLARGESGGRATEKFKEWQGLIQKPLCRNPPIPFLPRVEVDGGGKAVREMLLALGGGTRDSCEPPGGDPLIWGLPEDGRHWCLGKALAWPLIVEIVRHVMRLPGLAQRLDPQDASVIGLEKRWGFVCKSYPLTHQRERRVAQSSLNVAMRLKSPVKDNADRVRQVIVSGAPRIEEALRGARHVHFAWFELIESDTVLVLHTVYDGPFSAYIQDFALKVGDLFDALFECIENPPPMPVNKFPNEFVAHIQRYDRAPAMGYFFSAYPGSDVAHILRDEQART